MKKFLLASALLLVSIGGAQAQAYEPFLGQIMTFAGNFCPTGWAATNGQLLAINQYTALYVILGNTYGGSYPTTFALPKTQPIFTQTRATFTECIALQGVFPSQN